MSKKIKNTPKEIDTKLDQLIENALKKDIKYSSYANIAEELKVSHRAITGSKIRKEKIDNANLIKDDIDTKLDKFIKNAVEKGIKYSNYTHFIKELNTSRKVIMNSIKRRKKIDNANLIKDDIDTKLDKFIKNAFGKNIKYQSYKHLAKDLNINPSSITYSISRKEKIDRADLIMNDIDLKLDQFIANAIEKNIKYPSYTNFIQELGISFIAIMSHQARKERIDNANLIENNIDTRLDELIKKAVKKGTKYSSYSNLAQKLGITSQAILKNKTRKEKIDRANLISDYLDVKLDKFIANAVEKGTKYSSYTKLAHELNVGSRNIMSNNARKEKIDNANLIEDDIDTKLDKFIANAVEKGTKYSSYNRFLEALDMNYSIFKDNKARKEKIDNANLIEDDIDTRLDKLIANAIEKGTKYSSYKDMAIDFNISASSLTGSIKRKEKIHNSGIINTLNLELITANTSFIIEYCIKNDVKINSNDDAFYEYAYELHDIKIQEKDNFIEHISAIYPDIFESHNNIKLLELVKSTLAYLSVEDNESILWNLTIKLELLHRHNIYISDETLKEIITIMNLKLEDIFTDSIEARLAYTSKLIEYDYSKVYFADKLPEINTFNYPQAISKLKDKDEFYTQWKKYITWFLKNNLHSSHVSKYKIESNWDENIENLINTAPRFGKVFFLDNSQNTKFFKRLGLEGVAALSFYGAKKLKMETGSKKRGLAQEYEGLRACTSGFFLWLSKEGKALSSPKFLRLLGNTKITDIAKLTISDHKIHKYHNVLLSTSNSTENKKKINRENFYLHALYFGAATNYSFDITNITREEFDDYINISRPYTKPSGTVKHDSYLELLGVANNNVDAKRFKEKITISEYFDKQLESCDPHTIKLYRDLIEEFRELITKRFQGSKGYLFQMTRSIPFLFGLLSLYKKRLSRSELSNALNTIITSKAKFNIEKYLQQKISIYLYQSYISFYYKLFQAITIEEYHGVVQESWKIRPSNTNDAENRSFIRNGLPMPIYKLLQDITFKAPVHSTLYEFRKTTPTGELLDISWWEHKTSPIPAICLWLMTKIPRRSAHVSSLDANRFIVDDKNGNFIGLYFNTDKNPDFAKIGRDFIDLFSCSKLFSIFEIDFLKKYVKYIKDAYSDMIEVEYKNGGNYKKILPLFPSKNGKDVISYEHLINIFNKTLIKTQIIAREKAQEGFFNNDYNHLNPDDRLMKLNELKNIELIKPRNDKDRIIPKTLDEFEKLNYSDGIYKTDYKTIDYGIHTLRVSGASKLLADGADINTIMTITAHANLNVLASVYLKPDDLTAIQIIKRMHPDIEFGSAEINNPIAISSSYTRHKIMPLIENDNPEEVLKQLKDNKFQCVAANIISTNKTIYRDIGETYVDYGLEIASRFHPTSNWINKTYGICTIGEQCPQGTGGICSICPHLMFNAFHIKGVINKINNIVLDINLLQRKKVDSYSNPITNSALNEIITAHEKKISEYFGYVSILSSIKAQMSKISNINSSKNDLKTLVNTFTYDDLIGIKENSLIEMRIDVAAAAMELNIRDIYNDDNMANISYELLENAIHKNNLATIEELRKHTVSAFIKRYSESNFKEKRNFILEYFASEDEPTKLINSIDFLPENNKDSTNSVN